MIIARRPLHPDDIGAPSHGWLAPMPVFCGIAMAVESGDLCAILSTAQLASGSGTAPIDASCVKLPAPLERELAIVGPTVLEHYGHRPDAQPT
jgi:hypothetical protein